MEILRCVLTLQEPLFFATREAGRLYETGRFLHNYALTYALGLATSPYFVAEQVPRYTEELTEVRERGCYVTPAMPLEEVRFQLATIKYGEEPTHTEMVQGRLNTPSFGRVKELAPGSRFMCYVVGTELPVLPSWIRLGKWHSKTHVAVQPVEVREGSGEYLAACPLNPLDVPVETSLRVFDIVSMPPSSLLMNVRCSGAYYALGSGEGIPAGLGYTFPQSQSSRRTSGRAKRK
jgi:CRISPR-associated protein Csc1